jgi:hypothetical protein
VIAFFISRSAFSKLATSTLRLAARITDLWAPGSLAAVCKGAAPPKLEPPLHRGSLLDTPLIASSLGDIAFAAAGASTLADADSSALEQPVRRTVMDIVVATTNVARADLKSLFSLV